MQHGVLDDRSRRKPQHGSLRAPRRRAAALLGQHLDLRRAHDVPLFHFAVAIRIYPILARCVVLVNNRGVDVAIVGYAYKRCTYSDWNTILTILEVA